MYSLTSAWARAASGLEFFSAPASVVQYAVVIVIESPNWARVPVGPLNRAWSSRKCSTHGAAESAADALNQQGEDYGEPYAPQAASLTP